jgi:signal transduction histidine kinase
MSLPDDRMLLSRSATYNIDRRLQYILQQIEQQVPVDVSCIFTNSREFNRLELTALHPADRFEEIVQTIPYQWLTETLAQITPTSHAQIFNEGEIAGYPACSVLLWPLARRDILSGAVLLCSHTPGQYSEQDIDALSELIHLVQTVLDNRNLVERLITTEAIAHTAQAIAQNPSPRNIINLLRDHLFEMHVAGAVIALYGPMDLDRADNTFEYLEIQGSWSRRLGNDIGLGMRYRLDDFQDLLAYLDEQKFLTITDIHSLFPRMDHFSQMALKVDNIQSITLLPLKSEQRKLGIIAIASDEPYEFSLQEMQTFRIVTEFLTISTLAEALQRQADMVQRGRAALLDAVTEGVVMVLPDEASSVLTINQRFAEMFGVREDEVERISLCDLLDKMRLPAAVRRELRYTWHSLPPGDASILEDDFMMNGPRGLPCYMQWYSAPVYYEDQVIGRIYTFHDITAERESERLRSQLLMRISHELRTPLTSISGFAEFILESRDELTETVQEYTEIIHKNAQHLKVLFSDLIDFTRANAGELKLDLHQTHLPDVIIEAVVRLEPQYRQQQQHVVMDLDDDLPRVEIDIDRIGQVLTNLVGNAGKYSPAGAEVRVATKYIAAAGVLPRGAPSDVKLPCILVSIIDSGPGLSRQEADRIFLPFYRSEAARAQKIEGVGLGLAISRSIVELHGGSIWAVAATRRQPGGRFFFTLPLPADA